MSEDDANNTVILSDEDCIYLKIPVPWLEGYCGGVEIHGTVNCTKDISGSWVCKCNEKPDLNYRAYFELMAEVY